MSFLFPSNWTNYSRYIVTCFAGLLTYILSMHFSMYLVSPGSSFSLFFIPAGLACGFSIVLGYRFLPLIFIAKIIHIVFFGKYNFDYTPIRLMISGTASCIEAGIAIFIFNSYKRRFGNKFNYLLVLFLAIFSPILTAFISVLPSMQEKAFNFSNFINEFSTYYSGDFLGILVIVPIFINYIEQKHIKSFDYLVPVFSIIISYLFIYDYASPYVVAAYLGLIIPLIFGSNFGVSLSVLVMSIFFNWTNIESLPPFSQSIFADNLKTVQMFILSLSLISLSLMALKKEKILKFFIFPFLIIWFLVGVTYNINYKYRNENNKNVIDDKIIKIQQAIDSKLFSINLALNSNEGFVTIKENFTQEDWMNFHRTLESNLKIKIVKGFAYINLKKNANPKSNKSVNVIDSTYNNDIFLKIIDESFLEKYYFLSFQQDTAFLTPTLGLQIGINYPEKYKNLSFLIKAIKREDKIQGLMIMFLDVSKLFNYAFDVEFNHYNIDVYNVIEGVEAQKIYSHFDDLHPRSNEVSKDFISSIKLYNSLYYVHWYDTFNFFIRYEYSNPFILIIGSLLIFIISFFVLNKKIVIFKQNSFDEITKNQELLIHDKFNLVFDTKFEKVLIFSKDHFIEANKEALLFFNKKSLSDLNKISPFKLLNFRTDKAFSNSDFLRNKLTEVNIHQHMEFPGYFILNSGPILCDIKISQIHNSDNFIYALIFKEHRDETFHDPEENLEINLITTTSEKNTESTPVTTKEIMSPAATNSVVKNDEDQKIFNGQKILLVEDNEVNVFVTKKFLDRWGLETDVAENGLVAIEKIKNNHYDLVLMDLHMPIMDGFEATKIIRETHPFLTIIGLSADVFNNNALDYQRIGLDDFMTKPFRADDFLNILKLYLITVK